MKLKRAFGKIWIGPGDEVKAICNDLKAGHFATFDDHPPGAIGILNVADDYPEYPIPRDITYIHAGLNDGPEDWNAPYGDDNSEEAYINAVSSLAYLCKMRNLVFVHCHGGVSRSTFVVSLYMEAFLGVESSYARILLKELYPRANIHPKHLPFSKKLWLRINNELRLLGVI